MKNVSTSTSTSNPGLPPAKAMIKTSNSGILESCLLSDVPIVNFGGRARAEEEPSFEVHPHVQDDLALNILFTCRTFREEGRKIFWRCNTFHYSTIHSLQCSMFSRKNYKDFGASKTMAMIRLLSIRIKEADHSALIHDITFITKHCDIFPTLKTLQIHVVNMKEDRWMNLSQLRTMGLVRELVEAQNFYNCRMRGEHCDSGWQPLSPFIEGHPFLPQCGPEKYVGTIEEILITGLPDNHHWKLEALIARLVSTQLSPQGRLGIGRGVQGTQYYKFEVGFALTDWVMMTRMPQIEWIKASDVDQWVRHNGHLGDPFTFHDWMVELFSQVDMNNLFFRGWA